MALAFQSAEALVKLLLGGEKEVDEWLPKCYRLSRTVQDVDPPRSGTRVCDKVFS